MFKEDKHPRHLFNGQILERNNLRGLVLLHIWPLLKAHFVRIQVLLPWYALQLTVLVWLVTGLHSLLSDRLGPDFKTGSEPVSEHVPIAV